MHMDPEHAIVFKFSAFLVLSRDVVQVQDSAWQVFWKNSFN